MNNQRDKFRFSGTKAGRADNFPRSAKVLGDLFKWETIPAGTDSRVTHKELLRSTPGSRDYILYYSFRDVAEDLASYRIAK